MTAGDPGRSFLGLPHAWWYGFTAFWLVTDAIVLWGGVAAGLLKPASFLLTPLSLAIRLGTGVALFALARAFPGDSEPVAISWSVNMAGWLAVSLVGSALWYLHPPTAVAQGDFAGFVLAQLPRGLLVNINVLGVAHAAYYRQRSRLQEDQEAVLTGALARWELDRLVAEVQPPVVLGALEAIGRLAATDPDRAERLVGRLALVLRTTLRAASHLPLDEEIAYVEAGLELQAAQPGVELHWSCEVDPALRRARVPARAMGLLVEHLLAAEPASPAQLQLEADCDAGGIELAASRPGALPPLSREFSTLVRQACGEGCRLTLDHPREGWSRLRLHLPG